MEDATGEELDEDKKEIATEEMIVTGDIGDALGQEKATAIVNDIKTEIIKNNTKDTIQIAETINNVTNNYNVNLTVEQSKKLEELMEKISKADYDYKEMKDTLENISKDVESKLEEMGEISKGVLDTIKGWFTSFGDWVSGMFAGDKDLGILENTNDSLLGENVEIDATDKEAINRPSVEDVQGFFSKIWNSITEFFSGLFEKGSSEVEEPSIEEPLFEDTTTPKGDADFEIKNETESQVEVESEDVDVNQNNENNENSENDIEQSESEDNGDIPVEDESTTN